MMTTLGPSTAAAVSARTGVARARPGRSRRRRRGRAAARVERNDGLRDGGLDRCGPPASGRGASASIAGWSRRATGPSGAAVRAGRAVRVWSGGVRVGRAGGPGSGRRCAGAPRDRRSDGLVRSRSDRIGRPSGRGRDGRPGDRRRRVVPGESELVRAVVLVGHEVERARAARGPGSRGRRRSGCRPSRRRRGRASRRRAARSGRPASAGRRRGRRTPARRPRSSGRAGAGGSAGRAARRPPTCCRLAWTKRGSEPVGAPASAGAIGPTGAPSTARGTTRARRRSAAIAP